MRREMRRDALRRGRWRAVTLVALAQVGRPLLARVVLH